MAAEAAPRTIRELVAASKPWLEKRGVDNPRLDAELLVAHALGMKRIDLFMDYERPLSDDEITKCRALIVRRGQTREPTALILGHREFYALDFKVTKDVLVPRPETEHLVELALQRAQNNEGTFADVCTGSGCVAVALLKNRPQWRAVASDVSAAALAIARENAEKHGVADRLELVEGDLMAPLSSKGPFAFVVANPPYIRLDEKPALDPEVRDHEPALALYGEGADGLGHHRRLVAQAKPLVAAGGFIALEIGAGQGEACRALGAVVEKDLGGLDRVALWST